MKKLLVLFAVLAILMAGTPTLAQAKGSATRGVAISDGLY